MILGMSVSTFTQLHVVISLIGIATGFVVVFGMLSGKLLKGWTGVFLATTVLTTVTGFLFPINGVTPALLTGVVSSIALAITLIALYLKRLAGGWRGIYVAGAVTSLYLNSFVSVVQTFLKIPAFNVLAPTQKEPPFLIAQALVLALFVVLGILATRRFYPGAAAPARAAAYG